MPATKTLVICKSAHHSNTARVAHTIANVLGATVVSSEEVPYTSLDDYDLIGFGSGVYYGSFHEALWSWVRGLPSQSLPQKPAFVFSTSGVV
jgi:menaquinone-dependent protoporphyrinogen IX oxidase